MKRICSAFLSILMVMLLVPSAAFAAVGEGAKAAAGAGPVFSIAYDGYDPLAGTYEFTVRASAPASEAIDVAYRTFRGTTDESFYEPVQGAAITFEQGESEKAVAVAAREHDGRSLDSYVASDAARAQKYFGVALLGASAGTIDPRAQDATAAVVDTEDDNNLVVVKKDGMLAADGSGDMVERKFEHQNNAGEPGLIEGPLTTSYFSKNASTGEYRWSLYPAEHAFELDTTDHSDISGYCRLVDDYEYLYSVSYTLESQDSMHVYSKDVDAVLTLSNNGEKVLEASGDLEGWRTVSPDGTIDPLPVDLPSGANALKSTTKAEYCESHGIELLGHGDELVGGYASIDMPGNPGKTFVSREPVKLKGTLSLTPAKGDERNPGWQYKAEPNEQSYSKGDFYYDYTLSDFLLHYGVRDQTAPRLRAQSEAGAPSVQFSQAEYTEGDVVRVSVAFGEIVSSWPQGRKARLSVPAAAGASEAAFDLELAGGVGTNVLEFTCAYDGTGATDDFIARSCMLTLPAGIEDMAGNATQDALTPTVSAAFTKSKNVAIPAAPQIAAKDAEGRPLQNGGVGYSDITLTFAQPDDDPAKDAVAAYEVSLDGGESWQRVEAKTDAQGKPCGTFAITAKGDYSVVARALLPSDIRGHASDVFAVSRYDSGEGPGTFWIERPESAMKVIVHREGGTVGEQVVTVRGFRVDTENVNQLHLDRVKVDGIEDAGIVHGYYNEVTFPAGYGGAREIEVTNNAWPGAEHKLGDENCKAGVELAKVTGATSDTTGTIDRTRGSVYFDVSTNYISTTGIYDYDGETKGPKLEPGEMIKTKTCVADDMIVDPGETDTVELGNPFEHVSGNEGDLDLFYSVRFGIKGSGWSFAGMYDVTSVLTNGGVQLYKGWEDYDNTHDEVDVPNNTDPINNVELNSDYMTGPTKAVTDKHPDGADLKFFKVTDSHGDMGEFSVSLDSHIPDDQYVNVYYVMCDAYGIDRSSPQLKDWGVSDQTFYDGDEVRVYLEFTEPVVSANVSAKIWDKNRTKCYATLEASGEREAGTAGDALMGLGSKHLMLSGFQDGSERYMPADALLEIEITKPTDAVGNVPYDPIKPDAKYVTIDTDAPPPPDHVPDVPADKDTYGWFNIVWNPNYDVEPGTFTIQRVGTTTGRQEVFFRTLWGTNDPENPFFVPVDSSIVFEEGQKDAVIKIEEREASKDGVGYYSAISPGDYWEHDYPVKRTYGVEIYDVHGGAVLNTDDMSKRQAWRDVGYAFDEGGLKPWVADFDGYLYEDGKTFQRSLCAYDQAKAIAGYDGYSVETSFENDANKYFRLTCDDMYTQMHMYQNKNSFQLTVDDIWTRIYPGDGSKHELYSAHEDYDNTNQDHCYFPQDVPINSGNTVDDSSYTAGVSGKSVDGRDISRVWRLPVYQSDVVYNIQGYWADHVITEGGWLDYLFVDDAAPRPKTDYGAHSAFYLSDTKFSAGDYFAVTVAFDEIVLAGNGVALEVYDANGTAKLGEIPLSHDQDSGDSFDGHTSALSFDGTMPEGYKGGTYVLKLAGEITDMAGNAMDMSDPACQTQVTVEADEVMPPRFTLDTDGAKTYIDTTGTTWRDRATMRLVGDAANPAGTDTYYSLDGITFAQGDAVALTGENKAQRVWAKCVTPDGRQSAVVASDPVAIDTVAPTFSPAIDGGWTTPPAAIATNAHDAGSGVARVEVSGPEGASASDDCSQVEVYQNGAYDMRAVDNLGNASESATVEVTGIDGEAPPMPEVRSAGAPVELLAEGTLTSASGVVCYSAELLSSDVLTLAAAPQSDGSPEHYRYSYALADASGKLQGESVPRPWERSVVIPASYEEGKLTNNVFVAASSGGVQGHGVYVYCEDEAGNTRKNLLVLDCSSLAAATDVFVDSYTGTFDDEGKLKVSGAYEGAWTAESVVFSVRSRITWPDGVHDSDVAVERIEYTVDDGKTWTGVTDEGSIGTWRSWKALGPVDVGVQNEAGSFEIAPAADAELSRQLRFRAVASSESYTPNASEVFPVNVDGRTPTVAVALTDANGNELPLAPAADAFSNTPVTASVQAGSAHDAAFEMSVWRDGGWEDWLPLGGDLVSGDWATFTVERPGVTQMKVRVSSSTGRVSAEAPFEVHIDTQAPKLSLTSYTPGSADVEGAVNTLAFAVDDTDADAAAAVSGPKALRYRVDHPDGTMREGDGTLALAADGKSATGTVALPFRESGIVTVHAVDGASNASERVTRYVDEQAPELVVTPQAGFVDAAAPGGNTWYPSVTFDYEATDGIGGTVTVEYTEAGQAKRAEGASGSFTVSAEGVYDVVVTATDAAGKTAEERFRVQIVEAPVADVANGVEELPSPDADKQEVWEARQDVLGSVEDYLELTGDQKAKMPLDQLDKLEALYEIVLPVRSMDRLDDPTGICLVGVLLALDPSEIAIPDAYWDSADYPQDGFALYEFEVMTRDLAEGGMTADELAGAVDKAGLVYQDGQMWDVVVEKRTYAADDAGAVVSRELVGSDRWSQGARVVGLFPFADAFAGRDIRLVNVAPTGVEEIAYQPVEGASSQDADAPSMVAARLSHLSYYGFVEKLSAPPAPVPDDEPGDDTPDPTPDVPPDDAPDATPGDTPAADTPTSGGVKNAVRYGGGLLHTGDSDVAAALLLLIAAACLAAQLYRRHRRHRQR